MVKVLPAFHAALILALSLTCSQSFAATYYVSPTGSDANNGTSTATPFGTIAKAATVARSGDTVQIAAGTYTDDINFDGVQQSAQPVTFVGPAAPAAPVIVSEATLSIFNSNYVEFENLEFQGSKRFLVVSGSYECVFTNCDFTAGSEPLLIKDGMVTFETCTLTNFAGDGMRVDGEAKVIVNGSTISGCQEEGIEISATAQVVLNGTTISNSTGDGIKVDDSQGSIDPGGPPGGGGGGDQKVGLITGLDSIHATGGGFISFDSSTGGSGTSGAGGGAGISGQADLYSNGAVYATSNVGVDGDIYLGPTGTANVTNITGTINTVEADYGLDPIDPGNVSSVNDNANIPLTDKGNNAIDGTGRLVLVGAKKGGDGVDLPPGTYYFTGISVSGNSVVRISGPTTIYVDGPIDLTGGYVTNSTQLAENLKILVLSSDLVNLSAFGSLYAAVYAPDATVGYYASTGPGNPPDPAGIRGMVIAKRIELSAAGGIRADLALQAYADSITGSSGGTPSTPAPPSNWQPITTMELDITGGTMTGNRRAAYCVSPATFNAQGNAQFTNSTEWGLCLNGPFDLDTCTISDNGIGGVWLRGVNDGDFYFSKLTIGNNPQYGMYLQDCNVTFDAISLDDFTFTSGSNYILAAQGGSLTLNGVTITNGSVAAVYASGGTALGVIGSNFTGSKYGVLADQSTVTITDSQLSGNEIGLYALQNPTLTVAGSTTLSNNTSWGALVDLTSTTGTTTTFSGSTVSGNANGICVLGASNATVELPNTAIQNNTNDGLRFENSNLTLDAMASSGLQITNSQHGINSVNSTLTLNGLSLSGHSTAAIYAVGGNLTVNTSTLSGSGYGVSVNNCGTVTLNTCTLTGNSAGLYSNQNTDLQVNNSMFTSNTQWGASVNPKAGAGLCATFDGCTFHSNAGGITLVNAVNGQVSLQSGTLIRDNSSSGLHFANCNLTVNDQAGGAAWRTLRNGYGISSTGSTLTLSGISVEESSLYGVHCEDSSASLSNCTVTGVGGIYADSANNSLTVESTRLDASGSSGWGVVRYGGDLNMKNCVVDGFAGGVYLSTAFSGDQAIVNNSTLVNLTNDGVHLEDGDATVQNTIVVGNNAARGLTRVSGQLTHSHNILHGFSTPLSGTAADATELLKDPRFVDAANGDFTLSKGSPAINSGADLTGNGITIDMLGNARPSKKVFEIGAYEYVQDGGSLRVLGWNEKK